VAQLKFVGLSSKLNFGLPIDRDAPAVPCLDTGLGDVPTMSTVPRSTTALYADYYN
jgi:hypothetical protein